MPSLGLSVRASRLDVAAHAGLAEGAWVQLGRSRGARATIEVTYRRGLGQSRQAALHPRRGTSLEVEVFSLGAPLSKRPAGARDEARKRFEEELLISPTWERDRFSLEGRKLACYCTPDHRCHGVFLIERFAILKRNRIGKLEVSGAPPPGAAALAAVAARMASVSGAATAVALKGRSSVPWRHRGGSPRGSEAAAASVVFESAPSARAARHAAAIRIASVRVSRSSCRTEAHA